MRKRGFLAVPQKNIITAEAIKEQRSRAQGIHEKKIISLKDEISSLESNIGSLKGQKTDIEISNTELVKARVSELDRKISQLDEQEKLFNLEKETISKRERTSKSENEKEKQGIARIKREAEVLKSTAVTLETTYIEKIQGFEEEKQRILELEGTCIERERTLDETTIGITRQAERNNRILKEIRHRRQDIAIQERQLKTETQVAKTEISSLYAMRDSIKREEQKAAEVNEEAIKAKEQADFELSEARNLMERAQHTQKGNSTWNEKLQKYDRELRDKEGALNVRDEKIKKREGYISEKERR